MRSNRFVFLVSALILIVASAVLFFFLAYADAHKYEDGFDWVSSRTMQPLSLAMLGAFVAGLVLAVAGLLQRPVK
jgi:succinate dehydrogenase hydrophobic anchor subunit